MRRKLNSTRKLTWRNPLLDVSPKPFLDGQVYPLAKGSPEDLKAHEILRRFYTHERAYGEEDAARLRRFIEEPDKQIFVIWGDIGIGKSSFLRYQLASLMEMYPNRFYYGVVDMLRAHTSDAREQLEKQVCDIARAYFRDKLGGLRKGLYPYARHKAAEDYGADDTPELQTQTAIILEETHKIAGSPSSASTADCLLDAIEISDGPPLFIAVDNLDRAVGEDQHLMADLAARKLHNAKIYLILSLRSSSRILLDDANILGMSEKSEMILSPVNAVAMLRLRFSLSKNGADLTKVEFPRSTKDAQGPKTFPELLEVFLKSDSGQFVIDLAGSNSRKLIDFVSRIVYSKQLDSVKNITSPESCIAALLMPDQASFYPELSYILNLFDNGEDTEPGSTLIRFRVLEFIWKSGGVLPQERRFTTYFASLGYLDRVKEVIATFVGAGVLQTDPPRSADDIRQANLSSLGKIEATKNSAAQYFGKLLKSPWYFVCVKNDISIPEQLFRKDLEGVEYLPDRRFIDFLKEEEDAERRRSIEWQRRHGRIISPIVLDQPWTIAEVALDQKSKGSRLGGPAG